MRRRGFIAGLAGAAAWPIAAQAQQALPVIGFLDGFSPRANANTLAAFRHGLNDTDYVERQNVGVEYRCEEGRHPCISRVPSAKVSKKPGYVEGRSVAIEYRWAQGQFDRLPALAAIVATGGDPSAPLGAKRATQTIPINLPPQKVR